MASLCNLGRWGEFTKRRIIEVVEILRHKASDPNLEMILITRMELVTA